MMLAIGLCRCSISLLKFPFISSFLKIFLIIDEYWILSKFFLHLSRWFCFHLWIWFLQILSQPCISGNNPLHWLIFQDLSQSFISKNNPFSHDIFLYVANFFFLMVTVVNEISWICCQFLFGKICNTFVVCSTPKMCLWGEIM